MCHKSGYCSPLGANGAASAGELAEQARIGDRNAARPQEGQINVAGWARPRSHALCAITPCTISCGTRRVSLRACSVTNAQAIRKRRRRGRTCRCARLQLPQRVKSFRNTKWMRLLPSTGRRTAHCWLSPRSRHRGQPFTAGTPCVYCGHRGQRASNRWPMLRHQNTQLRW